MCGICGKLNLNRQRDAVDPSLIRAMMRPMQHRGPDEEGVYVSGPIGLGHKRLSIIDLSSGQQPLSNEDGTVWVVFNGEIYNFKELTSFLIQRGHRFRTSCDTEVIVHLYEEFGADCVLKMRGMFSFALWDEKKQELLLARDRVGIKPLYYHLSSEALIFGSEIKAILADSSVVAESDPMVVATFLAHMYTPGERTVFKDIQKLNPGHVLTVKNGQVKIRQYWDLRFPASPASTNLEDSMEQLRELLRTTVRDHMISDVPVGVLLSGGVDSTAMASFAVEHADREVSTFTLGFEGDLCTDERPYARLAADTLHTKHHEMTITAKDFLDFLPRYVWHMEEPVCEPPAVALYYVSKLAKDHGVTVLISGEGGDEAFAGYQTYRNLVWLERIKSALGPAAGPTSAVAAALSKLGGFNRFAKYAPLMTVPLAEYYHSRTSDPFSYFSSIKQDLYTPEFLNRLSGNGVTHAVEQYFENVAGSSDLDRMLYVDTKTWLPDDLLIKADKMTMANSLELRVPLLDHQVLEFAASLPPEFKLNGVETKYILKRALTDRIPKAIRDRKKTGFPVPYESWIRSDFNDMVTSILTDSKTIGRGYFRKAAVERLIRSNQDGKNHSKEIFSLLVLELWHRMFIDQEQVVL